MDTDLNKRAERPSRKPASRHYVFAKRCVNDFGCFEVGDRARGAFPDALVQSYLDAGILREQSRG